MYRRIRYGCECQENKHICEPDVFDKSVEVPFARDVADELVRRGHEARVDGEGVLETTASPRAVKLAITELHKRWSEEWTEGDLLGYG